MTTFLINGAIEQSNSTSKDADFAVAVKNVAVKKQASLQNMENSEGTRKTTLSSESSDSSLSSSCSATVKVMHKRNNSLGNVCPTQPDFASSKPTTDDALLQGKSSVAAGRPPLKRHHSLPHLTNQQKSKIFAHRSILSVKTQAEALKKQSEDDPNALYQAMVRRRRKALVQNGVVFDKIEIREYPVTIGDNPGGHWGPPLQLSWDYQDSVIISVEEFEMQHPPRRAGTEINMPKRVREDMLRRAGFSRSEIQEGVKQANLARNRRKRTIETLKLAAFHEFAEDIKRSTFNAFFKRGKKKKERRFLKLAMELHETLKLDGRSDEFLRSNNQLTPDSAEQTQNEDVRDQEDSNDFSDDLLRC